MTSGARDREERRLLIAAVAGVALLILIGVGLATQNERLYRLRSVGQTAVQAKILAGSVPAALSFGDAAALQEYVDALAANPDIAAVGVYDQGGRLAAAFQRSGAPPPPRMTARQESGYAQGVVRATEPVVQGAETLGAVFLRTQPEPTARFLRRQAPPSLLIVMALLVIAAMLRATRELQSRARALAEANRNLTLEMRERAKAEQAFMQSQKMESLGQLTGGVAMISTTC